MAVLDTTDMESTLRWLAQKSQARLNVGFSGKSHPFDVACMNPLKAEQWLLIGHNHQIAEEKYQSLRFASSPFCCVLGMRAPEFVW